MARELFRPMPAFGGARAMAVARDRSSPRYIVVQPAMPSYRLGLFEKLSASLGDGFTVYASQEDMGVLSARPGLAAWERRLGPVRSVLPGLDWQAGATSIPFGRDDVLVVSGAPRNLSTLVLLVLARLKGTKTVWWGHFWSSTSRSWRAAIRFVLMRLAHQLLFYTDMEVDEYLARTPTRARKPARGLNNGVATQEIVRLRAPYRAKDRPLRLLFIGRLTDKAEVDLLLRALAHPACAAVSLEIVGAGPNEAELRRTANNMGLAQRVAWRGGTADEATIAEIANQCRLFAYPGGVGLSLIHALAYGLPAIVHDERRSHMPEIAALQANVNGLTFRRGGAEALAQVIAGAIQEEGLLDRMSAAAVETTALTFNIDDMAHRFHDLLVAMGGDARRRPA